MTRSPDNPSLFPHFSVHWKTRVGTLQSPYHVRTPVTGYQVRTGFIFLDLDGSLHMFPGFVWDFGSGPANNNLAMIFASVAHDAFYELVRLEAIPREERKRADAFLRKQLREAGASWVRAWYVWAAVRVGYPIGQFFKSEGCSRA